MNQQRHHPLRSLARLAEPARPLVLLLAASAFAMACLLPWAIHEDETGLALLLGAVAPMAALGAYGLTRWQRARADRTRAIIGLRPLPSAIWTLSARLQAAILAARQVQVVVRGNGGPIEIARAVGLWSGTLSALAREDHRLLRSLGMNAVTLELCLHDFVNLGSPRGAVLAAQLFEDGLLGSGMADTASEPTA